MFDTEEELAAYLLKREQQLYGRLLLNRVFQGTVSAVRGVSPTQGVQVVKTGEVASDGMVYPVTSDWDPATGDLCDIIWRDDSNGLAAFPVSAQALGRMPPRHPYRARLFWTGSLTTAVGFNLIRFNNIDYDPSLSWDATNFAWLTPVDGTYIVGVKSGITGPGSTDTVACIYWNGTQIGQGSRAGSAAQNESLVVDSRFLLKGSTIQGYLYTGNFAATMESGSILNSMFIALDSR